MLSQLSSEDVHVCILLHLHALILQSELTCFTGGETQVRDEVENSIDF